MVTEGKWHINAPQLVDGIPVRHVRLIANVNEGNLVLIGTESWGNVQLDTTPGITNEDAQALAFDYIEGREEDHVVRGPELLILPQSKLTHASYSASVVSQK